MQSAEWVSLIAGFGGAVLGALISWVATHAVAERAAKRAARELGKTQAYRVIMKFALAVSTINSLNSHIQRCLEESKPGPSGERWNAIVTLVSGGEPEPFASDDLSVLLEGKEYKLVQDVVLAFHHQQTLCKAFNTFAVLKSELLREIPVLEEGGAYFHPAKSKLKPELAQKVDALDSLINSMSQEMPLFLARVRDIQEELTLAFRKHLRDENIPKMRVSDVQVNRPDPSLAQHAV